MMDHETKEAATLMNIMSIKTTTRWLLPTTEAYNHTAYYLVDIGLLKLFNIKKKMKLVAPILRLNTHTHKNTNIFFFFLSTLHSSKINVKPIRYNIQTES